MQAMSQTRAMIAWWTSVGIDRADLAVRRRDGSMIWHFDLELDLLPLAWARAENVRRADVYVRPARTGEWPLVFLDDVDADRARAVARKYAALVVRTSIEGGCHVWLASDRPLREEERGVAQRWLAQRISSDPASVSGEHLGRLPGFKNWKRAGTWVNLLVTSSPAGRRWDAETATAPASEPNPPASGTESHPVGEAQASGRDTSDSGREWGLVCGALEAGYDAGLVFDRLVHRARPRKGRQVERYAQRTVERALAHVCGRPPTVRIG